MTKYDYLIVGSGFFGATFAYEATKRGKRCLVLEKRNHIGGNAYSKEIEGINVHVYGAHIFHTNNKHVWDFMNQFTTFNNYVNSPIANYKGKIYNLPFNMNTFNKLWGVVTPEEALKKIEKQRELSNIKYPSNLEEQAISLVGIDVYNTLIKGYTEKQWGRSATELPASIIKRIPVRFTYNNNYFSDVYQGIPIGGYTNIVEKMLDGIDVLLQTNFLDNKEKWTDMANKIIYTGPIDEYYDYRFGLLEYRNLRFETEVLNTSNHQGNAVVNYTDIETPYTRIIEHKHFEFSNTSKTVISKEYSEEWNKNKEPYYPINDKKNQKLLLKYLEVSNKDPKIIFGGRLGEYGYFNMDEVVEKALSLVEKLLD